MSISKILNSLENSWERDDILLKIKNGLSSEEIVNEFLINNELQVKELNSLMDAIYKKMPNYLKPEIYGIGISHISYHGTMMTMTFELNQFLYHNHLNLNDYKTLKFGFEYLTQMGTPIRGGLTYRTPMIDSMEPVSMLTFGSGKRIGNLTLDFSGTYSLQSFNYPDLFPVEGDIRPDYDVVRNSQLHLSLSINYQL